MIRRKIMRTRFQVLIIFVLFLLFVFGGNYDKTFAGNTSPSLMANDAVLQEIGRWPDGICTVAITDGDTLLFTGNGSAVDILSTAQLNSWHLISRINLPSLPVDLAYRDGWLYVLTNNNGLLIYNVKEASQPVKYGNYDIGDVPYAVGIHYPYVFITYQDYGLSIVQVQNPDQPTEAASYSIGGEAKGMWLTDTLAFITRGWNGLVIFNISDPTQPAFLGEIDTYDEAYDVYVQNGYAYVADLTGIEVIDVSKPTAPTAVKRLWLDGWPVTLTGNGLDRLYVGALEGGIKEVEISNPADPHFVRDYKAWAWDVWLQQNRLYVAGYNQGLHVLSIANLDTISYIANYSTAYTTQDMTVNGRYMYVANWKNGLYVVDLQASPYPKTVGRWNSYDASVSVAVDEQTEIVYLADQAGFLRQIDVSNPTDPREIGFFDFGQQIQSHHVLVSERYVYSSAGYNGWYAINKHGRGELHAVMFWSAPETFVYASCVIRDTLALIAGGDKGLFILNIADTAQVIQLAQYKEDGISVSAVCASNDYAFINNGDYLYVLDIHDPTNPQKVGEYDTGNTIHDIQVQNNRVYLANSYNGVLVLDVNDPANPAFVARFNKVGDVVRSIFLTGDTIFAAGGKGGVYLLKNPVTGINASPTAISRTYHLLPNFPNPFNPTTVIPYELPQAGQVKLVILNPLGQIVKTLINGWQTAGRHQVVWDGRSASGQLLSSGIYFYCLKTGSFKQTRKMILIR